MCAFLATTPQLSFQTGNSLLCKGRDFAAVKNLVLDELDRELERRGHRYVRYADDCNIYVRSERAGQRVMRSVTRFITQKLKLKVNETKSAVARPQERKFLGFSFSAGPEVQRVIAPKALDRFKRRIREITRRAKGVSIETTIAGVGPVSAGLAQLFRLLRNTRSARLPHPLGPACDFGRLCGGSGKHHAVAGRHCCNWGCAHGWRATPQAAGEALGTSRGLRPYLLGFPMHTSNRLDFRR